MIPHAKFKLAAIGAFLLPSLTPSLAAAGGFYVPEVGARAVGLSGAQVSNVDDATALFHNVAGIAGPQGTSVQASGLAVLPTVDFFRRPIDLPSGEVRFDPVRNTNKLGVVPFLGVTTDANVDNLGIGLGVSIPFGAHLVFPEDGSQRHVVTEVDFKTIYVTPSIAYRFWDRLSIGAGFSYIFGSLELAQVNALPYVLGDPEFEPVPHPDAEGMNNLKGKDTASFGANVGIMYTDPDDRFGFGFSMMTPTTLKFQGDAVLENPGISPILDEDGVTELVPGGRRDDTFTLEYPLPLILRAGLHVYPIEHLMIAFDLNWQRWETFDELYVDLEENPQLQPVGGAFASDIVIPQQWSNTLTARVGIEAQPVLNIPVFIRAGTLYDQSPISDRYFDVLAPDSDKWSISGGVGYRPRVGKRVELGVDLGYMHLFLKERNIAPIVVGPDELSGNDDDNDPVNDTRPNNNQETIPGSDKTILNKPAPSFYYGVTRARFDLISLAMSARF